MKKAQPISLEAMCPTKEVLASALAPVALPRHLLKRGKLGLVKEYATKEQFDNRNAGKQSKPGTNMQKGEEKYFDSLAAAQNQLFPGDCAIILDNGVFRYFQYLEPLSPALETQLISSYKRGDLQFPYKNRSTGSKHARDYMMFGDSNIWERCKTKSETGKSQKEKGYVVFHLPDDELEAIHRQRKDAKEARKGEVVPARAAEHALQLQADKKAAEKLPQQVQANITADRIVFPSVKNTFIHFFKPEEEPNRRSRSSPPRMSDTSNRIEEVSPSRLWVDMVDDDADDNFFFGQLPARIGEFKKKADCNKPEGSASASSESRSSVKGDKGKGGKGSGSASSETRSSVKGDKEKGRKGSEGASSETCSSMKGYKGKGGKGKGKGKGKDHGRTSVPSHTSGRQQDWHSPLVQYQ